MNGSFNAYLLAQRPKLKRWKQHVTMKRNMILQDDIKEYWGFYLLKGKAWGATLLLQSTLNIKLMRLNHQTMSSECTFYSQIVIMISFSTDKKKILFWTNKKFVFFFNCLKWEKIRKKLGKTSGLVVWSQELAKNINMWQACRKLLALLLLLSHKKELWSRLHTWTCCICMQSMCNNKLKCDVSMRARSKINRNSCFA